jgi:Ca2+-binding RTX toxin-like protein
MALTILGTELSDRITPTFISEEVLIDGVPYSAGDPLPDFSGNDTISGDLGNDTINGGAGDDNIDGGEGNDSINGGADTDTADYSLSALGSLNINLTTGIVTSTNSLDGTDTLVSIESVLSGEFDDVIFGSSGNDTLAGGDGNDTVTGGAGDDDLYGDDTEGLILPGELINTVDYSANTAAVFVDLVNGTATSTESGNDSLTNFSTVYAGAGDDTLIGDINDNTFRGGAGNDLITGGTDPLGEGVDVVDYSTATTGVSVDLNSTTANDGQGGIDTLAEIEGVIGSNFDDVLTGTVLDDVLSGGAGNDSVSGLEGADILNGGAGNDTVSGGAGNDIIQVGPEGVAFGDVLDGGSELDTLLNISTGNLKIANFSAASNIEAINAGITPTGPLAIEGFEEGANANNLLDFSATTLLNVDFVNGGAGNDTVVGGAGDIEIFGGEGDDSLTGGGGKSYIEGNNGNDTITGGASDNTLDGGAGNDVIAGAGLGKNELFGRDGNDILTGGDGENTLDGGAGNDTITGGSNKDFIILGDGVDVANAGAGDDTFGVGDEGLVPGEVLDGGDGVDAVDNIGTGDLKISAWNSTNNIEFIYADVDGVEQKIVGDATDNVLDFSATKLEKVSSIEGGAGADTITGSSEGDNTINGDAGNDVLTASGFGKNILNGGADNDILTGGSGESTLDGGAGNDTLTGGNEKNSISGGDGNDILIGGAKENILDGGAGDDTLTGGDDKNVLDGGAGNDTLTGGLKEDTLTAGTGNDTLTGGDLKDNFVFELGFETDVVTDFQDDSDLIDLRAFGNKDTVLGTLSITPNPASGTNVLITSSLTGFGSITLQNFTGTLTESDFLFL